MRGTWASRLERNQSIAIVFLVGVAMLVFAGLAVKNFTGEANLRNLLIQVSILGIVSAGQTIVIITGGIDLSMPWVMTASGVLLAELTKGANDKLVWAVPLVLLIAACVGVVNGLGVAVLKVPAIVMTLATNTMLSGALLLYVGAAPPSSAPDAVQSLAFGDIGPVPANLVLLLLVATLVCLLLTWMPFGRRLYALGTSERVSRLSGVNATSVLVCAYALASVSAGVAGILLLGFVGNADTGMGNPYLFSSIAAVIVGGASVLGGSGHYVGTLAGVILLTVLNAILIAFSLGAGAISILYGVAILVSASFAGTHLRTRRQTAAAIPADPFDDPTPTRIAQRKEELNGEH